MRWNKKYNYPSSSRATEDGIRRYVLGEAKLPSVTSILDATKSEEDKAALANWRERTGHKEAEAITKAASSRGSQMHSYLESFLLGRENLSFFEDNEQYKKMAKEIIDKGLTNRLEEICGVECTLYYPEKYAGTADCIGVYNGEESLIDFKTAKKVKPKEWIEDYFLQCSAYANAHNVMYGTKIKQIVILMVDRDQEYKKFVVNNREFDHYTNKWKQRLIKFHNKGDK